MQPTTVNHTRYRPGQGHYESFFQRGNHPTRPLAFWVRYTIFSPAGHPEQAIGELWAIYFDGETGQHSVAKAEFPLSGCIFDPDAFRVQVGEATLSEGQLRGQIGDIAWDLTYTGAAAPLFLLPERLYTTPLPAAKSLVGKPLAGYNGTLTVHGQPIAVENWIGSQNHNWGRKHTDQYAWGQVAGFENAPDTFLEVATARLRFGRVWTPPLTLLVLRHRGQEIRLNSIARSLRASAQLTYFDWHFASQGQGWQIRGHIQAQQADFVGLRYYNPPGGIKTCLNSKIAACTLTITDPQGQTETLITQHRAAFEILTDDDQHGIALRV